jgi:hypothetical protein
MTFSTLMVHLELEHLNDARLQITGDLAEKFNAKVIGIAAADPQPPDYAGGSVARGFVKHEQIEVKKRIEEAEARFRSAIDGRARDIEWRSALERPNDYVAREARAADLIIAGSNRDGVLFDRLRRIDPSDLVMMAGRPVLLVPPEVQDLKLGKVLVAWKDTREARRAVPMACRSCARQWTSPWSRSWKATPAVARPRTASKMWRRGSRPTRSWHFRR